MLYPRCACVVLYHIPAYPQVGQLKTCARSSTDRAFDYGSKGWGFESLRARSFETATNKALTSNLLVGASFVSEANARQRHCLVVGWFARRVEARTAAGASGRVVSVAAGAWRAAPARAGAACLWRARARRRETSTRSASPGGRHQVSAHASGPAARPADLTANAVSGSDHASGDLQ